MSKLKLKNISKRLGNLQIIRDVSLEISAGEFVVFVGPSGCGKSTLLRLIAGLESIGSGDLEIDGRRVNDLEPRERGIGMVFQSYALYPHMSVYDNIGFGLKLAKTDKRSLRDRVLETARVLQLDALLQRKPKELSGGQRQRVAMGRAMAREPDILLFDEPLSNLDASLRVQMRNEIAQLHKRLHSTVVYVTHDQVEAMTLADKIVVLNAGCIEQVGSPRALYERPASRFVAGFIGSPRMNFLKVHLHSPGLASVVETPMLGRLAPLAVDSSMLEARSVLSLGVRPEHLSLQAAKDGGGIRVVSVEYLGSETYVYLDAGEEEPLVCRCEVNAGWRVDDRVEVRLQSDSLHLFREDGVALLRTSVQPEVELPRSVRLGHL